MLGSRMVETSLAIQVAEKEAFESLRNEVSKAALVPVHEKLSAYNHRSIDTQVRYGATREFWTTWTSRSPSPTSPRT